MAKRGWLRSVLTIASGLVAATVLLLAGAAWGAWWFRSYIADANRAVGRIVSPHGVQQAGYVRIGGVRQWITIAGQDRRAPVMLFLHGGPGEAISDLSYTFQRPWEDYFTVVQWDQRGAGRSGIDGARASEGINRERLIADTIEVIEYLRRHLGQQRVVLVGQSAGTVLGIEVAHRRPDLVHAVLSMGQQTSWRPEYFDERRRLLMAEARRNGDAAQFARLARSGGPRPFHDGAELDAWTQHTQRELILTGHMWRNAVGRPDINDRVLPLALTSPSLSIAAFHEVRRDSVDEYKYFQQLYPTFRDWTAERSVGTRYEVPVIFFMGRYDWTTPITAARRYYDKICAPWKAWVEFPNSAHVLTLEEPGRMVAELVRLALPAARDQRPAGVETCPAAGPAGRSERTG